MQYFVEATESFTRLHMTINKTLITFDVSLLIWKYKKNSPTQYSKKKMTPIRLKNLYSWKDKNSIEVSAESCQTRSVLSSFKRDFFMLAHNIFDNAPWIFLTCFTKRLEIEFFIYMYTTWKDQFFLGCNTLDISPLLNKKVYSS